MHIAGRALRSLALTFWLGGILFFAAVLAPTAFHVLPTRAEAALVVGGSIGKLHTLGLWCGVAMLLSLRLLGRAAVRASLQLGLVLGMMALTIGADRLILAPMAHDQALAGGNITALLPGSPLREDFDARHAWSTRIEGLVALAGIALTLVIAAEPGRGSTSSVDQ